MGKRAKKLIIAEELTLDTWLELIEKPEFERKYIIRDCSFPTHEHLRQYISRINERSEKEIKDLLRLFLVVGGNSSFDSERVQAWIAMDCLVEMLDKSEFAKRVFNSKRHTFEGNTWVLDLLPRYPQTAIDAIRAYIRAHAQFLHDARWDGLDDAIAIIRARYMDCTHSREVLLDLRPRDFEYFVARLFSEMGYEVEVTPCSRDGGYDIAARKNEPGHTDFVLIECKRYEDCVGVKEVRALNGVVESVRANKGIIVTTADFTRPAKSFAASTKRIELIGFDDLNKLSNKFLGQDWPNFIDNHISHFLMCHRQAEEH